MLDRVHLRSNSACVASPKVAFAEAEEEVKNYKSETTKANKEAKKIIAQQEKEAARKRKETIKLKKGTIPSTGM